VHVLGDHGLGGRQDREPVLEHQVAGQCLVGDLAVGQLAELAQLRDPHRQCVPVDDPVQQQAGARHGGRARGPRDQLGGWVGHRERHHRVCGGEPGGQVEHERVGGADDRQRRGVGELGGLAVPQRLGDQAAVGDGGPAPAVGCVQAHPPPRQSHEQLLLNHPSE
jgi:hypothetical protein